MHFGHAEPLQSWMSQPSGTAMQPCSVPASSAAPLSWSRHSSPLAQMSFTPAEQWVVPSSLLPPSHARTASVVHNPDTTVANRRRNLAMVDARASHVPAVY